MNDNIYHCFVCHIGVTDKRIRVRNDYTKITRVYFTVKAACLCHLTNNVPTNRENASVHRKSGNVNGLERLEKRISQWFIERYNNTTIKQDGL